MMGHRLWHPIRAFAPPIFIGRVYDAGRAKESVDSGGIQFGIIVPYQKLWVMLIRTLTIPQTCPQ